MVAVLNSLIRNNHLKKTVNIFLKIYGFCYVFSDEIILEDRVKRRRCNWEILPPGGKPSSHLINILKLQGEHTDTFDVARLKQIETYKAEQVVEGINGFHGYYAYIFTEYCVLESAIYGNATYIISKENWEVLSQKTKQELIKDNKVIEKVIHTEKWKNTIYKTFKKLTILKN